MDNPDSGSGSDDETQAEEAAIANVTLSKSSVHDEFTPVTVTTAKGKTEGRKCNHCSRVLNNKNPTNLKKHLELKHVKEYKIFLERNAKDKRCVYEERKEKQPPATAKNTVVASLFKDKNQNMKIDEMFPSRMPRDKRSQSLPPRPKQKEDLSRKLLAVWIGSSNLPLSMIDEEWMEIWLRSYDPQVCN